MAGRNSGGRSTTSSYPTVCSSFATEVNIVERCWEVQPRGSTPKAGLVVIHGATWHSAWFGELGDLLSSPEYSIRVSAPDLPSYGLSGDPFPGLRGYVSDFGNFAEETGAAVKRARAALPEGCPLFLLGESMGGLCVLQHLMSEEASVVDGVILCGALIQIAPGLLPPKTVFPLLRAVAWLRPTLPVPGFEIGGETSDTAFGDPWLRPTLPVPGSEIGGKTFDTAFGDPAVAPVARADPLVCEMAPTRMGMMISAFDTMDAVKRDAPEKLKPKSVLMIHYIGDRRTLYDDCRRLVDALPIEDKVCIPLEGDSHQIFQDTPEESRKHIEMVGRFINERIK